jgi:hypothetical protein
MLARVLQCGNSLVRKQGPVDRDPLELVQTVLASLQFGELVLTVHDGEIVQLTRTERFRLVKPERDE